ncbi:thioesterase family protein [Bradyrhizobium sp. AZCC 1693]|uniref:thioesterase family protein n=1 Tax=Bradyrhizobium sp. AZCC 1693 TaxID=3117029 RepID=UPI002FEF2E02
MQTDATYRGTVYPWQCDHVGHMNIMWHVGKFDEANWNLFARVHMDRQARKSTPFAAAIRNAAAKHLDPAMA